MRSCATTGSRCRPAQRRGQPSPWRTIVGRPNWGLNTLEGTTLPNSHALGDRAARQLANTTKTPPQLGTQTPRWLVSFLPWTPVESGTFRVNRVKDASKVDVACG